MIDPVLKKFGLSQARKSVKNLNSNNLQPVRTPQKQEQIQKRQFIETLPVPPQSRMSTPISRSSAGRSQRQSKTRSDYKSQIRLELAAQNSNNESKIKRLINYLKSNYCKICPNHNNDRNLVKFICLRQSCSENLGCAQCFLYRHSDHEKSQIGVCLRDLQQFDVLMKDSFDLIMSQKSVIKSQFIKQIDMQIANMCDQFHKNIQFFKNKALKEIDDHLFAKYEQLQILSSMRNTNALQLSDNQLVMQILKIDIKGIQKDLSKQLNELQYQKLNYMPVVKLFEQMNGALGHFMSQFKKCFPKIYRIRAQSYSQPKYIDRTSKRQQYGSNNYVSQFKSGQTQRDRTNQTNPQ